jgi:hypothetical protein
MAHLDLRRVKYSFEVLCLDFIDMNNDKYLFISSLLSQLVP